VPPSLFPDPPPQPTTIATPSTGQILPNLNRRIAPL
jgi:hypothetical protein